jgi:large subunit ribosomal protein L30
MNYVIPKSGDDSWAHMSKTDRVKVRWVRSAIGFNRKQRATLVGLGLRRLNQTVELEDTPAVRGMITKVIHLVVVEEN